jgi:hypothetical protein
MPNDRRVTGNNRILSNTAVRTSNQLSYFNVSYLFNDATSSYDYVVPATGMKGEITMEDWWNDKGQSNRRSQCHPSVCSYKKVPFANYTIHLSSSPNTDMHKSRASGRKDEKML